LATDELEDVGLAVSGAPRLRRRSLPLDALARTAWSAIFPLSRSFGVRVLPWLHQTGLNGIPLELSGKADAIATTGQLMRPADTAAEVTTPIARLRSALLGEIFLETPDVGDGLDLGGEAELIRSDFHPGNATGTASRVFRKSRQEELTENRVIEPEWRSGVALGTKVICSRPAGAPPDAAGRAQGGAG
jgi:hypothetical protein